MTRFGPPHPVTPWEEELDVSGISHIKCTQYGFMADGDNIGVSGSEDCLYLNVYVPESAGPDNKLPVMMWVFGGYFTAGSAQWTEYGAMNWADKDVIIVAPNHRLGPLGFTTFGNEEAEINPDAPGNQGLRDLVAALEWIQANIDEFGGDKNSVTIFGESSGSWACSYLHMSPLASGLFHRAILQSGSMMNPFWLPHTAYDGIYQVWISDVSVSPELSRASSLATLSIAPTPHLNQSCLAASGKCRSKSCWRRWSGAWRRL